MLWPPVWFIVASIVLFVVVSIIDNASYDGSAILFITYLLLGVINLIVYNVYDDTPATTSNKVIAEQYGFESGKEYPLTIGPRTGGSSGSVRGSFYFGSGSVSGSQHPTSAFPFSFENERNRYIINVPTDKTNFIKVDNESDQSLSLTLNDIDMKQTCKTEKGHVFIFAVEEHTDCHQPRLPVVIPFGVYVEESIESVTVEITEENYEKLLGSL